MARIVSSTVRLGRTVRGVYPDFADFSNSWIHFPRFLRQHFFTALGRGWGITTRDSEAPPPFIDPIHAVICIGYRTVHPVCRILNRVIVGIRFNCWKRLHCCSVCCENQKPLHRVAALFCIPVTQRFSHFFQVGTTFISQNVLRTTLLLGLSNSLGLP